MSQNIWPCWLAFFLNDPDGCCRRSLLNSGFLACASFSLPVVFVCLPPPPDALKPIGGFVVTPNPKTVVEAV